MWRRAFLASPLAARAADDENSLAFKHLARLKIGNRRHAEMHPMHPHLGSAWRAELSKAQHPFACVLACADSRVPPEMVFDTGLGDLFVVRVAGNIVDDAVLGSLEYAVEHLHVPLIVVLGHSGCGAVTAAIQGGPARDHTGVLIQAIAPAVREARKRPGPLLDNAVRENMKLSLGQLRRSEPVLRRLEARHEVRLAGGVYRLDTGKVVWEE